MLANCFSVRRVAVLSGMVCFLSMASATTFVIPGPVTPPGVPVVPLPVTPAPIPPVLPPPIAPAPPVLPPPLTPYPYVPAPPALVQCSFNQDLYFNPDDFPNFPNGYDGNSYANQGAALRAAKLAYLGPSGSFQYEPLSICKGRYISMELSLIAGGGPGKIAVFDSETVFLSDFSPSASILQVTAVKGICTNGVVTSTRTDVFAPGYILACDQASQPEPNTISPTETRPQIPVNPPGTAFPPETLLGPVEPESTTPWEAQSTKAGDEVSCPRYPEGSFTSKPIIPATGEEVHTERDYTGDGPHALNFVRYFRSSWSSAAARGLTSDRGLGQSWGHNHTVSLQIGVLSRRK